MSFGGTSPFFYKEDYTPPVASYAARSEGGKGSCELTPSFFAEFLKPPSLARLGTLIPTHQCRFAVRLALILAANLFSQTEKVQIPSPFAPPFTRSYGQYKPILFNSYSIAVIVALCATKSEEGRFVLLLS